MVQHMKNDLEFRRTQARQNNKMDSLLALISTGVPFAEAQAFVTKEFITKAPANAAADVTSNSADHMDMIIVDASSSSEESI